MTEIKLGDRVQDQITGFQGIVTARTEYLNKCIRIQVSPEGLKEDGAPKESGWFDDVQLIVVDSGALKLVKLEYTGGPDRPVPPARDPVR